jgi:predicted O-methyltransferase YrrM
MRIIDFLKTLPHVEPAADYLNAVDCYPFLNALAKDLSARRVLEVGVRFGYSAVAFIYGNAVEEYVGIDNESYDSASESKSKCNLEFLNAAQPFRFTLFKRDTQSLSDLAFLGSRMFDFIHIDGDHSRQGALTDMKTFWNVLCVGGHMLVDDSLFIGAVGEACRDFAELVEEPCYNVKTFRGTWVFLKTTQSQFPLPGQDA